ncbi:MAG: O-antigen ligase family protein [Acidimicrobiia bacterium]|nr:O-antigen ligase family protein [Acidimicrobiia bacterium]
MSLANARGPGFTQSLAAKLNIAARALTLLGVTLPMVSIALSQIFLACAILAFALEWFCTRRTLWFPPIAAPLLLLMLFTAISLAWSPEPWLGRAAISKFWLFAIVLLVTNLFTPRLVTQSYLTLFGLGSLSSLLVIGQFLIIGQVNVETRLTGFMGHWMTLSGELLLVFIAGAGWILFHHPRRPWLWLAGLALVGVALSMTLTRSVWLATLAGVILLLLMRHWHWKTLVAAGLATGVLALAAPDIIQKRFSSMWDARDPSNYARLAIWRAGWRMVEAHPWVGVGPQRISTVFYDYHPIATDRNRSGFYPVHMHNNLLQFAAERGIPCALAWLWLMVKVAADHWTHFRQTATTDNRRQVAAIGFAATIALFLAGLFEFNFGDSEVLMIFLFLVSASYVVSARSREAGGLRAAAKAT